MEFSPIIYQLSIRLFVWFCSTLCREPDTQNTSTPVFSEIYEQAFCLLRSPGPSARHDGKYLLSGHPVPSPCPGPFHESAHSLLRCGPGRACLYDSSHLMGQHTEPQRGPVPSPRPPRRHVYPLPKLFTSPVHRSLPAASRMHYKSSLAVTVSSLCSPCPQAHIHPKSYPTSTAVQGVTAGFTAP